MSKDKKYSKIAKRLKDLIKNHITDIYDVTVKEEYSAGNKMRYDFYMPYLSEPIGFEADGIQHKQFVPFFHGNLEGFEASKNRDFHKDFSTNLRGGHIIRISNEKITDNEFKKIIEDYIEIFKEGDVNIPKWEKKKK